jgi:hypothetical protein
MFDLNALSSIFSGQPIGVDPTTTAPLTATPTLATQPTVDVGGGDAPAGAAPEGNVLARLPDNRRGATPITGAQVGSSLMNSLLSGGGHEAAKTAPSHKGAAILDGLLAGLAGAQKTRSDTAKAVRDEIKFWYDRDREKAADKRAVDTDTFNRADRTRGRDLEQQRVDVLRANAEKDKSEKKAASAAASRLTYAQRELHFQHAIETARKNFGLDDPLLDDATKATRQAEFDKWLKQATATHQAEINGRKAAAASEKGEDGTLAEDGTPGATPGATPGKPIVPPKPTPAPGAPLAPVETMRPDENTDTLDIPNIPPAAQRPGVTRGVTAAGTPRRAPVRDVGGGSAAPVAPGAAPSAAPAAPAASSQSWTDRLIGAAGAASAPGTEPIPAPSTQPAPPAAPRPAAAAPAVPSLQPHPASPVGFDVSPVRTDEDDQRDTPAPRPSMIDRLLGTLSGMGNAVVGTETGQSAPAAPAAPKPETAPARRVIDPKTQAILTDAFNSIQGGAKPSAVRDRLRDQHNIDPSLLDGFEPSAAAE